MLGKNFKYRGLDLSDGAQSDIVLTEAVRNIPIRTEQFDRANFHGTYTSASLAGGRLFSFRGQVFGATKAIRWAGWKKLIDIIQPEPNPFAANRGFYDLEWQTDGGLDMVTKAKVWTAPEAEHDLNSPVINFSFALYSENEKVYAPTVKSASGGVGIFGGVPLATPLATPFSGYSGYITCENEGNWLAPIYVVVSGEAVNPQIINLTNGNAYRIGIVGNEYTSTLLEYDNRNLTNDPTKTLVVTDIGTNIKGYRSSGGDIFLSPGENNLIILTDNENPDIEVDIYWRDTYFLT